jgi:CelD/BcsL family acetyltransferase involved in cellulose biosynthesis
MVLSRTDHAQYLHLKVYRDWSDLQELELLWDHLVSTYPPASIFCTWEWLASWWQSFGKNRELFVLALFDSASHLLGLAPFSISTEPFFGGVSLRILRLLGDGSEDSDNLDFPVLPGYEEVLAGKVLECLQEHRKLWNIAQLNTMPMESPVARHLIDLIKSKRGSCFEYSRNRLTVELPARWDEYLNQISTKERKNFVYYGRKLRKAYAVRIYRCASEGELPGSLEALFRLHQLRWQGVGERGSFADEARRNFYADLSRRLLRKKRLDLWIAELDGEIVAVQFAMRYGKTVYSLQEGYDPQHASDRVGFILRAETLKQLVAEGIQVYDFLGGDDQHKARWRAKTGSYVDLKFAPPWSTGSILLQGAHRSLAAKEWLRTRLPRSFWSILHQANLGARSMRVPASNWTIRKRP